MPSRSTVVFLAALALLLTGCSAGADGPDKAAASNEAAPANVTKVRVAMPVDRPLHGKRKPGDLWRTSGLTPQPVMALPYTNGVLLEGQLEQPADGRGVRAYDRDGTPYFHPVGVAQYALAQLDRAQTTGSRRALRSAKANARELLDNARAVDGALYFPYPFDFRLGGREAHTIHAPWYSAMAQGQALSLFSRLLHETGQQKWRAAAEKTFRSMDDIGPRKKPWSAYVDARGYLWLEEYAGDTRPLLVLNGHMFAMFGLWDYHQMTGSKKAAKLFDAAATTLREYLPSFRAEGEASFYCLRQPLCAESSWQSEKYHGIVEREIRFIADMTDERWFVREANRFARDFDAWPLTNLE